MFRLIKDIVTIVTAPVKVAAEVAGAVTRPVAQLAEEVVEEVKDFCR